MNDTIKQFHKGRIELYLWAGLGFFVLYSFAVFAQYSDNMVKRSINNLLLIGYAAIINFLLFEFVLPLFKKSGKQFLIWLFLIVCLLVFCSFGIYAWRWLWIKAGIYTDFRKNETIIKSVLVHSQFSMATVFFFGVAKNIYTNIKLKQAAQQLLVEKKEAELNFLKAQTNPHFLFNTLNNIYSLARDKSNLAPESILRLSKILRFMLYETGGAFIAIEDEIRIITDYIELEKLRYDDSLEIKISLNVENPKQSIPPLLLLPLIENAFKHGVSETINKPSIQINLLVNKQELELTVKNSMDNAVASATVKENVGLSNLRRQLELLYRDYKLIVGKEQSVFIATLRLNLTSHV